MPTIIAVFDDMKSLENAQNALREAGRTDAVLRVVDQSAPDAEGSAPLIAGKQQRGVIVEQEDPQHPDFLGGLELEEGETGFLQDALADGARLLVLEGDAGALGDLVGPHAQRIVPAT